ncbi:DNA polymerase epsilon catalytic subunit A, putative [Theobroma cacao]|uniref:DNA polymerase epsilon catalytic subunit A, putative n=1 Tax=Theobroma cacao TaxID=3641 RepID=A0A061FCM9_THECC|nr:DNA polymerase epsilon catalytic subunit A, putative [Theobroma cacao]
MGSLMSGWDSPVSDPKSVIRKRNRSLTKEEIDAYWRSKKKTEEEHLKAISSASDSCSQLEIPFEKYGRQYMRSSSMPLPNTKQSFLDTDTETSLENIIKKNGWWTRSNWAFLNEPPVLERPTNSYTSQYHIANLAASKLNTNAGIST